MKIFKTVLICAGIILLSSCTKDQHSDIPPVGDGIPPPFVQGERKEELTKLMEQENVPGAQIMHMKNGKAISYFLGEKKYASNDLVGATTLFQCASMTKTVSAYAALRLLDKGVFDLDTPLSDYWEYDRLKDEPYRHEITARMALNHTTGFPNWLRNQPLKTSFRPGTAYRYSGEGYFYLQQVLEHLTGKSFEKIVEEEVLVPLDMMESNMLYDQSKSGSHAYGHDGSNGLVPSSMRKFTRANAAYSLWTTASDYTKFVQKGLLEGKGLKPETLQMMLATSSSMNPSNSSKEAYKHLSYGLGVVLQENELGKQIIHTGSNSGRYLSIFIAYPKTKESLVILTNGANGGDYRRKVAELLLEKQTFWSFLR